MGAVYIVCAVVCMGLFDRWLCALCGGKDGNVMSDLIDRQAAIDVSADTIPGRGNSDEQH